MEKFEIDVDCPNDIADKCFELNSQYINNKLSAYDIDTIINNMDIDVLKYALSLSLMQQWEERS